MRKRLPHTTSLSPRGPITTGFPVPKCTQTHRESSSSSVVVVVLLYGQKFTFVRFSVLWRHSSFYRSFLGFVPPAAHSEGKATTLPCYEPTEQYPVKLYSGEGNQIQCHTAHVTRPSRKSIGPWAYDTTTMVLTLVKANPSTFRTEKLANLLPHSFLARSPCLGHSTVSQIQEKESARTLAHCTNQACLDTTRSRFVGAKKLEQKLGNSL